MSFFGFDATGPKPDVGSQKDDGGPLDFEETHRGFGEYAPEEDDYLNNETFGTQAEVGADFDFGHGSGTDSAPATVSGGSTAYVTANRSYAAAAAAAGSDISGPAARDPFDAATLDLKPMESLWSNQSSMPSQQFQSPPSNQVLSMEEIERQQREMQQMASQQQRFMGVPSQGYNAMPFPQNYMPQQSGAVQPQMNQVHFPGNFAARPGPPPFAQNVSVPMQQMPGMFMPQAGQQQVPPPPSSASGMPLQQQNFAQEYRQPGPASLSPAQAGMQQPLETSAPTTVPQAEKQHVEEGKKAFPKQQHELLPNKQMMSPPRSPTTMHNVRSRPNKREPMTLEEQRKAQARQLKVDKIMKHSGLMTPRDKDFITRYQLSQIVTDDPYNEDFYFQVYKIIQSGGVVGKSNKDMIARAYLEHSGHRLGGRYKRADVALQRMQNQVEKAVTVAKERPQKNRDYSDAAREGVLGKITSSMNSKAPRRQLQLPLHKSIEEEAVEDSEKSSRESTVVLDDVAQSLDNVQISQNSKSRRRSSYAFTSTDHGSVLSRSGGRKFVLSLIETVYGEALDLEAKLRSGEATDNTALWETLHVGDESYEVCPFISMLSFDKGIKIMPRIFNFLDNQQKLQLLQTFFAELSHLNVIIVSSFKTTPTPTETQLKKIDLFQVVFLKIIVSFLSNNANFLEIMGLLMCLIKNNNVSFISTSKVGLNLITVLISRAALIRQDVNRTNALSSPEISAWNEVYDKLFTLLEGKLVMVFPPKEYTDKVVETSALANVQQSRYYDQAYIWQFLASLALSGKLNHQRIIIDEIRDEIFGTINAAEDVVKKQVEDATLLYRRDKLYQDLNLFLNVMGLVARDGEITELK